jgi:hypothetical protein
MADIANVPQPKRREQFCANVHWYGTDGFKSRMRKLVGFERKGGPQRLRTMAAYDLAYDTLYGSLPDCQHDTGLCWG